MRNDGPIGLILAPTRELTQQIFLETKKFAKIYSIRVAALMGGENKHAQWKELKAGVEILIATPGRLIEMIKKKATNMKRCTYVILDEADRMFSMGFEYQVSHGCCRS
jgi:ATP-dependent RNA helicase DDX42